MRHRLLAAVVVLAIAGCTGGGSPETTATTSAPASTTSTAEATTTSTSSVTCAADDSDPSGLEPLVVDHVEGFQLRAANVGRTGPSDLLKAIEDDGAEDARQVLTDLRFRRGYQRLWTNEFGEEVVLFVYEFCDDSGPTRYAARASDLVAASGAHPQPFATDAPMSGFSIDAEDVVAAFVSAAAGPKLVHVIAYARGDADAATVQARATEVVTAQLAQLHLGD